jgi:hypothetical protein
MAKKSNKKSKMPKNNDPNHHEATYVVHAENRMRSDKKYVFMDDDLDSLLRKMITELWRYR